MRTSVFCLWALCLWWLLPSPALQAQAEKPTRTEKAATHHVDGVTISTRGSGRDWGGDRMTPTMEAIRKVGAGWVATHPYAWIRNDGRVGFRDFDVDDPPPHIVRPIRDAHALGLKIMIKPHLGYWGSKFSWRGEIEFARKEENDRFWTSYRTWITKVAAVCKDADAFVVGTELDRMLDDGRWRTVIRDIRAKTEAPLTYAANWTDYHKVPFWDALDAIGVQAYFPLADKPTDDEAVLRTAWRTRMQELRTFSTKHDRHIVFTELGYTRSKLAPVEPWKDYREGPEAASTQQACMRVALEEIRREPRVVGSFLWKWFPGPARFHDFHVQDPEMQRIIRAVWSKP